MSDQDDDGGVEMDPIGCLVWCGVAVAAAGAWWCIQWLFAHMPKT